jgi:hypothetical protein
VHDRKEIPAREVVVMAKAADEFDEKKYLFGPW